eukprot:TRINITY_DN1051_c0_g1_i1.p1 TRINITY_DN1051_c0_g1~~TRINITY_DN1051_c0_g1_i1.p1  ORF type:complete len:1038 (+),score=357.80 TRINITY_DN1051_c0_g1_i1:49-3162(+)
MASFLDRLANAVVGEEDSAGSNPAPSSPSGPRPAATQGGSPAGATEKISLDTATRDELVSFVRKLEARRRTVEGRLKETVVAYKKLNAEYQHAKKQSVEFDALSQLLHEHGLYKNDDIQMLAAMLESNELKVKESLGAIEEINGLRKLNDELKAAMLEIRTQSNEQQKDLVRKIRELETNAKESAAAESEEGEEVAALRSRVAELEEKLQESESESHRQKAEAEAEQEKGLEKAILRTGAAEEAAAEAERALAAEKEARGKLESALAEAKSKAQGTQAELEAAQAASQELKDRVAGLGEQLREAEAAQTESRKTIEELRKEVESASADQDTAYKALQEKCAEEEARANELKEALAKEQAAREEADARALEFDAVVKKLESSKEVLRKMQQQLRQARASDCKKCAESASAVKQLEDEVAEARAQCQAVTQEMEAARAEISELSESRERAMSVPSVDADALRKEIEAETRASYEVASTALKQRLQDIGRELEEARAKKADMDEDGAKAVHELEERVAAQEKENQELRDSVKMLQGVKAKLIDGNAELKKDAIAKIKKHKAQAEASMEELSALKDKLHEAHEERERVSGELTAASEQLEARTAELAAAKEQLEARTTELASEKESSETMKKMKELLLQARQQIDRQKQAVAEREEQNQKLSEYAAELSAKLNAAQEENGQLGERVTRIEEEFRAYKLKAKTALQQAEENVQAARERGMAEKKLQKEVAKLQENISGLVAHNKDLQSYETQYHAIVGELEQMEEKNAQLLRIIDEERSASNQKLEHMKTQIQERKDRHGGEIQEYQREIQRQKDEHASAYHALEQRMDLYRQRQEETLDQKQATVDELNQQIAKLNTKLDDLVKERTELSAEVKRLSRAKNPLEADSMGRSFSHADVASRRLQESREPLSRTTSEPVSAGDDSFLQAQKAATHMTEIEELRARMREYEQALRDSEELNRLSIEQQRVLKDEIRELERAQKREGANLLYLKNVIVKYMITKDHESMLPVLSTILAFSPEDIKSIKEANQGSLWGYFSSPKKR